MNWDEIRAAYPNQWLIIEALDAHTTINHQRHLDQCSVIEQCANGSTALASYRKLHQNFPQREFYFLHTSRIELDIREKPWLGIRGKYASSVEG